MSDDTDKMRELVRLEFRGVENHMVREIAALRMTLIKEKLAKINQYGGFELEQLR